MLPQVSDVGGLGDLMETKVKENNLGRVVAASKSWEDYRVILERN